MKQRQLPGIDKPVSVIVQGAMGLLNVDDDAAFACLDAALDAGITAFDTAHIYAYGERTVDGLLGSWATDRAVRDDVVLMAKGAHPEPPDWTAVRVRAECVHQDVVDTLDRMGLDYLDVWSFHRDDPTVGVAELVDAAHAEIAAGTIGAWGVSNWSTARLQTAIDYAESAGLVAPVVNSAHYSLVDQVVPQWDDVVTLTGDVGDADRRWHLANDVPVLAWSGLSGGVLSQNLSRAALEAETEGHLADVFRSYNSEHNWDRRSRAETVADQMGQTLADVSIAWLLQSDLAPFAIVGGANPTEIRNNAVAADIEISEADHAFMFGAPQ